MFWGSVQGLHCNARLWVSTVFYIHLCLWVLYMKLKAYMVSRVSLGHQFPFSLPLEIWWKIFHLSPAVVAHFSPSTWEAKAGRSFEFEASLFYRMSSRNYTGKKKKNNLKEEERKRRKRRRRKRRREERFPRRKRKRKKRRRKISCLFQCKLCKNKSHSGSFLPWLMVLPMRITVYKAVLSHNG